VELEFSERGADELKIVKQLDLEEYVGRLRELFARRKPLYMEGDRGLHYRFIWMRLSKQGVPGLKEIFEAVKIVRYFLYLKGLKIEGEVGEWLESIEIPDEVAAIEAMFDESGRLLESVDERLASLKDFLRVSTSDWHRLTAL